MPPRSGLPPATTWARWPALAPHTDKADSISPKWVMKKRPVFWIFPSAGSVTDNPATERGTFRENLHIEEKKIKAIHTNCCAERNMSAEELSARASLRLAPSTNFQDQEEQSA